MILSRRNNVLVLMLLCAFNSIKPWPHYVTETRVSAKTSARVLN